MRCALHFVIFRSTGRRSLNKPVYAAANEGPLALSISASHCVAVHQRPLVGALTTERQARAARKLETAVLTGHAVSWAAPVGYGPALRLHTLELAHCGYGYVRWVNGGERHVKMTHRLINGAN